MKSLRLDNSLPHPLFVPVLLAAVVLAVYYPALSIGIHSIDDPGIIAFFSSPPPLNEILLPGRNYYYRPIIELSFYVDSKLWGMEPSVMHLENILLHFVNAMLVYLISRKIAARYTQHSPFIPVFASLLFALHPLNVEAVSWIAGRTDPLAALFILSASFYLLSWLDDPKWLYAVLTPAFFGLGILTKESAFGFLPVSLLFVLAWPALSAKRRLIAAGSIFVTVTMIVAAVVLIWKGGVVSLERFLAHNNFDAADEFWYSLVSFGFYVKKMLLPLPLNFAITDVPLEYGLLGILSIIVLVAVLVLWRLPALFFMASALMILPVLVLATKQIAWTPLAERYMYMPTAFLCVGTSCMFCRIQKINLHRLAPLIIIIVCIAGVVSFDRNLLWKDKLAFYQDAVAKSPGFGSLYYELGGVYLQQRQFDKAAEMFAVAERLNKRPSMKMPIKLSIMATKIAKGNCAEARDYFFQLFGGKKASSFEFLELLYAADYKRFKLLDKDKKPLLAHDLLETLGVLYLKKPDPFWLYQSGKMALVIGDSKGAADFFRRAYVAAPLDAHYKAAAKTYFMRLEAGK